MTEWGATHRPNQAWQIELVSEFTECAAGVAPEAEGQLADADLLLLEDVDRLISDELNNDALSPDAVRGVVECRHAMLGDPYAFGPTS